MASTINDKIFRGTSQPANSTSTAYEASRVVSSTPALLCGVAGYNSLASTQFIQFHNAASLPADGVAPVVFFPVGASDKFAIDYNLNPREFSVGLVVCNSTTGPTKTIGAANCWFDVQYKPGVA